MPRKRKHRHVIPTNLRRKCEDTQSIKQVNHRHITIPTNWTSPKTEGMSFEKIPGVVIKNYHTTRVPKKHTEKVHSLTHIPKTTSLDK